MKLRDKFIVRCNQTMANMDWTTRIQWVQIVCLSLTTIVMFTLMYYYDTGFIIPGVVAMICASMVFPPYLFYVIRNVKNLNRDELRKLRSVYFRISIYCVGAVIFYFLLIMLINIGAHWSKNVDSCDVTVFSFKFNIC